MGIRSIIPPNTGRPSNKPPTALHRRNMHYRFKRKADKGFYGQRWQSETVDSMIKRNLGSALRARSARRDSQSHAFTITCTVETEHEQYPQVNLDETNTQLIGEVRDPLPAGPGKVQKYDNEYVRNGTANLFMVFEPLAGWREVTVTDSRTRTDWAGVVKALVDGRYKNAKKLVLTMDNLNTHSVASLYEAFAPEEARRIADKLEIHYTPKHGSWLNMAEIELSVLARQCLDKRIEDKESVRQDVAAWEARRNAAGVKANWQLTTANARIKLRKLHPTVEG